MLRLGRVRPEHAERLAVVAEAPRVVITEFVLRAVVGHQGVRECAIDDGPDPQNIPRPAPPPPPEMPVHLLRVGLYLDQDKADLIVASEQSTDAPPVAVEARVLTVPREIRTERHQQATIAPATRSGGAK